MPSSLGVLLRESLTDEQRHIITDVLHMLAAPVTYSYQPLDILGDRWEAKQVHQSRIVGLVPQELVDLHQADDAIGVTYHEHPLEEVELAQYQEEVGFVPHWDLSCWAMLKAPIFHRLLGIVALALAEALATYVDLENRYFIPQVRSDRCECLRQAIYDGTILSERPVPLAVPVLSPNGIYSGPGQAFEVYTDPFKPFSYTVMDAVALRVVLQASQQVYLGN